MSYAYLPIVWSGLLAHYLGLSLEEGGKVLQVGSKCLCLCDYNIGESVR